MALIKCPECGHQVSDTADTCPECGFSISGYIFQQKIDAKRKAISEAPPVNNEWLSSAKKKFKTKKFIYLIFFLVSLVGLIITLAFLINKSSPLLLGLFLLLVSSTSLFLVFTFRNISSFYKVYTAEGSTIFFYKRGNSAGLIVDGGKEVTGDYFNTLNYKLPSGSVVSVRYVGHKKATMLLEDFAKFEKRPDTRTKTIVNNFVTNNITKTRNSNPERSDMEKILIKNAKIDALASIDPTNTEKAKEQIDIVNKLDDLD